MLEGSLSTQLPLVQYLVTGIELWNYIITSREEQLTMVQPMPRNMDMNVLAGLLPGFTGSGVTRINSILLAIAWVDKLRVLLYSFLNMEAQMKLRITSSTQRKACPIVQKR